MDLRELNAIKRLARAIDRLALVEGARLMDLSGVDAAESLLDQSAVKLLELTEKSIRTMEERQPND